MAQQQQQQQTDNSMAPLWVMILGVFTLFIVWATAHEYIVSLVFFLNVAQAKAINFFLHNSSLSSDIYLMQTLDPKAVNWTQLMMLTQHVGDFVRYPVIFMLLLLSLVLYNSDITTKYRKVHNMNSLRAQEQKNWPAISPVVQQDLIDTDINSGPWAMALSPMEFARKYGLLKINDALLDDTLPGQEMTASIRRSDAKRVFTLQLGPAWDGFERCPFHVRALSAMFMARMHRDKQSSMEILTSLDKTYVTGKLFAPHVDELIRKHQSSELVQDVLIQHAYLLTVVASLLEAARSDGVVPTSEFLWLKPVDRRLWYMLNCVGRQTPFAEVGGPFAHWRAEKKMGRPSRAPMIDEATRALEIAVREVKLTAKEMKELKP